MFRGKFWENVGKVLGNIVKFVVKCCGNFEKCCGYGETSGHEEPIENIGQESLKSHLQYRTVHCLLWIGGDLLLDFCCLNFKNFHEFRIV